MASNDISPKDDTLANALAIEDDTPGPPISVPDSGDTGEGGKIKMIVQLVKKCLGVKDIAAMRLSLPASLLEPIPNLEYWHYLDRPDIFAAINDSDDPFERMLAVLRFSFTKDIKFHGKICKPYNSVLGEHFRAHWDIIPVAYSNEPLSPPIPHLYTTAPAAASTNTDILLTAPSDTVSVKSRESSKSTRSGISVVSKGGKSPSTAPTSPRLIETNVDAQVSDLSLADSEDEGDLQGSERLRIVYVTEQISHHPPISAYYASCPARSLELMGIDQISAKVSGTALRVSPGSFNKGIFVRVNGGPGSGEIYNITHPVASVNGLLRGSFYVTVGESTVITCSGGEKGQNLRAIIDYKDESWLGKARFLLEGVIHAYTEGETQHEEWIRVKDVPQSRILAVFDGSWRHVIRWRRVGMFARPPASSPSTKSSSSKSLPSSNHSNSDIIPVDGEYATLIDLSTLKVIPKTVRPLESQLPHESRKLWENVTGKLLKKEFGEANKEKMAIEQRQRNEAAERKRRAVEFVPRYFDREISSGIPTLTAEGWAAVEEEVKEISPQSIHGTGGAKLVS